MGRSSRMQAPLLSEGERFSIQAQADGTAIVLILRGELDLANMRRLSADLEAALALGRQELVLELAELSFLDVGSASLIVWADRRMRARHGALTLRHPRPHIQWLIEFCATLRHPDEERDRAPWWSPAFPLAEAAAVAP